MLVGGRQGRRRDRGGSVRDVSRRVVVEVGLVLVLVLVLVVVLVVVLLLLLVVVG